MKGTFDPVGRHQRGGQWVQAYEPGATFRSPNRVGLALLPFVFVAGSFLSQHPRAPGAATRAMCLSLLVGIPVSALASDAVTGLVAGIGAGRIVALRMDGAANWRSRATAIAFAAAYTFVLVRTVGEIALLSAPVFPFTAIDLADHLSV